MSRYSRSFNNNSGLLLIALVAIFAEPTWQLAGWVEESSEWAGSLLIAICALGRIWCTAYIGGKKNRELVDIGPYSVVRNPLYVFNTIGVVGIGLLTGMFVVCLAVATIFVVYNGWVIRREEDKLSAAFGPDYDGYLRRVPRWLPDPSLWRQPGLLHVNANLLMISIRDASVFFLALPALELLKRLHETGIIPALIRVW